MIFRGARKTSSESEDTKAPGTKDVSLNPSLSESDELDFQTNIFRLGFGARTGPVDQRQTMGERAGPSTFIPASFSQRTHRVQLRATATVNGQPWADGLGHASMVSGLLVSQDWYRARFPFKHGIDRESCLRISLGEMLRVPFSI